MLKWVQCRKGHNIKKIILKYQKMENAFATL